MATALISLDGVLRTETGDPIHAGIKLFRVMNEHYRVVLATDGGLGSSDEFMPFDPSNWIFSVRILTLDAFFPSGVSQVS